MQKLTAAEIRIHQTAVPKWVRRGAVITRAYIFSDFAAALKFVNGVGRAAEKAQHHPDIDIRWNRVRLALTTHDAGGLTARDFALALQLETLSATFKPEP